jgi:IS1 family transposase
MSVLSTADRLRVLAALVDGTSERAIERLTGVSRLTISRFALKLGLAAQNVHNQTAHDLSCSLIESDEIWSYVGKKQARVDPLKDGPGVGEAYTFVGLAMPSRYVVAWKVGKRDQETADAYVADLRARLVVMPAMTSDGFAPYVSAIGESFGAGVDYGQTIKNYRTDAQKGPDHRYEPPRDPFITKKTIFGAPDLTRATTAHIERNNGTMRHHIGRMRRLCYAFSKDLEHHKAAVALCYCHYNLCWILRTMRVTPALAANVTNHVWELPELLDALLSVPETAAPLPKPLAPRVPEGTARELPNGRGFLRVVPRDGDGDGPGPAPVAPAPTAPAVPSVAVSSSAPAAEVSPQLDLLSWRPKPPMVGQLSLLGDLLEPGPGGKSG